MMYFVRPRQIQERYAAEKLEDTLNQVQSMIEFEYENSGKNLAVRVEVDKKDWELFGREVYNVIVGAGWKVAEPDISDETVSFVIRFPC